MYSTTNRVAEGIDIGDAMKRLKTQHAGAYDGAMASAILRQEFGA